MPCPVCSNKMELVLDVFDPVNIIAVEDFYCTQCFCACTTYYKLAGDEEVIETFVFINE